MLVYDRVRITCACLLIGCTQASTLATAHPTGLLWHVDCAKPVIIVQSISHTLCPKGINRLETDMLNFAAFPQSSDLTLMHIDALMHTVHEKMPWLAIVDCHLLAQSKTISKEECCTWPGTWCPKSIASQIYLYNSAQLTLYTHPQANCSRALKLCDTYEYEHPHDMPDSTHVAP